jgi:hypothetical protein
MSNSTISTLPSGSPAQPTDAIPAARSGSNVKLPVSDFLLKAPGADQSVSAHHILPASGNTTQSLGSVSAPWIAELYSCNTTLFADAFPGATADAKINAALAALPSTGGVINAKGLVGSQSFSAAIVITKPCVLLLPAPSAATFTFSSLHAIQVKSSNVVINGGSLQMNGINCIGIFINNSGTPINNVLLDDVTINGDSLTTNSANQFGIELEDHITHVTIRRCKLSNMFGAGIYIGTDFTDPSFNNTIENNWISGITGTAPGSGYGMALNASGPSGTKIVNNHIEDCQRHSIYMATGGGYYCAGNYIRNHGGTQTSAGGAAIEYGRGSDSVIIGNIIDGAKNVSIQVFSADTTTLAFALTQNIVVSNNVIFGQQAGWNCIDVSSDATPPTNVVTGLIIANNSILMASISSANALIGIQWGKQISIRGNHLSCTTSVSGNIYINALNETSGTATYTDEIHISNNFITSGGGSDSGILFSTTAAVSAAVVSIRNNRVKSTVGVSFAGGSFTSPNVSVFDSGSVTSMPTNTYLPVTLYDAAFVRSAGNTAFPDVFGDGTHALVIGGKSDGSGTVSFGGTTAVQVPKSLSVGGDTAMSANPRSYLSGFIPSTTGVGTWANTTLDKAITITRVQIVAGSSATGQTTAAIVRVGDGTNNQDTTIANSTGNFDSGAISLNIAAGATLLIRLNTASVGGTPPTNLNVIVQYKMQ